MRRLLLPLAGLAAISCATSAPAPATPKSTSLADRAGAPPGFEHQTGEILTEYDLTRDGKPEVWKYSSRTRPGGRSSSARRRT